MKVVILAGMMDKFNKRRRRIEKEQQGLTGFIFCISYNHENLFKLYERSTKRAKTIDRYIDNMDESDKVIYEENIVKRVQKFRD
jgi:hypothetical protein